LPHRSAETAIEQRKMPTLSLCRVLTVIYSIPWEVFQNSSSSSV